MVAAAALLGAAGAASLGAQPPRDTAARDTAARDTAAPLGPLTLSVHAGSFRPAGGGQLFALLDRALTPGGGALRPRLAGGELRVTLARRWRVLVGVEGGSSSVASASRATPTAGPEVVAQQTSLSLTSVRYAGAEWEALRWRCGGARPDRARLVLGAGLGLVDYELHQRGDFVDADRRIAFTGDLRSAGRGGMRYLSAAAEVPLTAAVALAGTARRQAGRAPMHEDYATFDRLDLGGTQFGFGLRVRSVAGAGRR